MKCDELKPVHVPAEMCGERTLAEAFDYYDREPVDEAIAELKQKIHDAEMAKDDAEAANTEYREDICKLKAENERLERELTEQQKAYCVLDAMYQRDTGTACKALGTGSVDCKILRVTNHALWMARALALSRFDVDKYIRTHMMSNYWKCGDEIFVLACKIMQNKIDKTKEILIEKAKEYK